MLLSMRRERCCEIRSPRRLASVNCVCRIEPIRGSCVRRSSISAARGGASPKYS